MTLYPLPTPSSLRLVRRLGAGTLLGCTITLNVAAVPDPTCVDYFTIGESDCRPKASTPVAVAPVTSTSRLAEPQQTKSEVDKYLDNYGKPPREFVEFYLNPTSENASKWVQTYQGMLQKGQDLSKAWGQAEELYKTPGAVLSEPVAQAITESLPTPNTLPPATTPSIGANTPAPSFGAFATVSETTSSLTSGIRPKGFSLTYYYSQTCPYCARMTPDLAALSKEMSSKLVLTCVDVTPVGPTSRPDESYITSKLPCDWRLPEDGEVDREGVKQTPTLVITKEGNPPVRLSGYVPLAQLRRYF